MQKNYENFGSLILCLFVLYFHFSSCSFSTEPDSTTTVGTTPLRQAITKNNNKTTLRFNNTCSGNCSKLPAHCYNCNVNNSCTYGLPVKFDCVVNNSSTCIGNRTVQIEFQCRYCFLTKPNEEHTCIQNNSSCKATATPRERVKGVCTVHEDVFCLGKRKFSKLLPCSWTSGYIWSTAFILSITLGGFGVDRFYLGFWREGLGKLFSFGGLGVWTLIDVILIGTGYLGPHDGSLYVY